MAYIIKRYPNRKLYDPQASRYVTLDDLKRLIQQGTELKVEDATTGEDLTSLTLAQILLEGERTHQAALPAMLLHQLIRHGEAWYEFVQRLLASQPLHQFPLGAADAERFWKQWSAMSGWPQGGPGERPSHEAEESSGRTTASANHQRQDSEGAAAAPPSDEARSETEPARLEVEAELNALRDKLSALEKRLPKRNKPGKARTGRGRPARRAATRGR